MDEKIATAIRERTDEGTLRCTDAFRIAEELRLRRPSPVGQTADEMGVEIVRCQLGLFGYGDPERIVRPADNVPPELEQAIREGLILGRLPCPVAWALAVRFGLPKTDVANAAEKLHIRIGQCQLGAF